VWIKVVKLAQLVVDFFSVTAMVALRLLLVGLPLPFSLSHTTSLGSLRQDRIAEPPLKKVVDLGLWWILLLRHILRRLTSTDDALLSWWLHFL